VKAQKRVALFDGNPDACILTDRRGTIEEANAAAAKMLGMPADRLEGRLLIGFVARRDTRIFRDRLHSFDPKGDTAPFEVRVRPRGGSPYVVVLHPSGIARYDERLGGVLWTIRPAAVRAQSPGTEELRQRVLLAVLALRTSLTAVQTWTKMLGDGVAEAGTHADTIQAIAKAAEDQTEPLKEIEEIARTVGDGARSPLH
jgi:PAS domain S-box-containing protein